METRPSPAWARACSTFSTWTLPRTFAAESRPTSSCGREMGKGGSLTTTCTRPARCLAVTTTAAPADSAFRSSPAGWPAASPLRKYEGGSGKDRGRPRPRRAAGARHMAARDEGRARRQDPAASARRAALGPRPGDRDPAVGGRQRSCGDPDGRRHRRLRRALATNGRARLDMSAFDRIFEVDEVNLTVRCESGVNGLVLEKHLNERGLTLGHFPSSLPGTTLGGLIATRSSGQESSRYGSSEDMVLGLAIVLPDGTFAAPRPGPRSAVGPALHQLWLGSEGALGVVLGAVLRLHRLPESVIGRGYGFADLAAGLEAMRAVVQSGMRPLVLRLYDAEDTAFNGYDLPAAGCLLVVANAGLSSVAEVEAAAVKKFAAAAEDLGRDP